MDEARPWSLSARRAQANALSVVVIVEKGDLHALRDAAVASAIFENHQKG